MLTPKQQTSSRYSKYSQDSRYSLALGFLILAHLHLAFLLYQHQILISRDSILFLEMAQDFFEGNWKKALEVGHHPLYPFLIQALTRFFQGTPDDFMRVGQLLNLGSYLLVGAAVYGLSRQLFNPFIALIALLLTMVQPYFCREAGDVLTDMPYLAFYLWGVYFFYRGILQKKTPYFFYSGALSALAYLTRPEGLILLAVFFLVGLLLLGTLLQKKFERSLFSLFLFLGFLSTSLFLFVSFSVALRAIPLVILLLGVCFFWILSLFLSPSLPWLQHWTWTLLLRNGLGFFLFFMLCSSWYMFLIGGISLKQKSMDDVIKKLFFKGKIHSIRPVDEPDPQRHLLHPSIQASPLYLEHPFESEQAKEDKFLLSILETAHPFLSFLFVLVLSTRLFRILQALFHRKPFPYPEEWILYLFLMINFLVLAFVFYSSQYLARRHSFSVIALCLPYAAYGLDYGIRWLFYAFPRRFSPVSVLHGVHQKRWRTFLYQKMIQKLSCSLSFWFFCCLSLSVAILALKELKPVSKGHLQLLALTQYLLENFGKDTRQVGNLPRVALYSQGIFVPFPKPLGDIPLSLLSDEQIDLVVLREDFLYQDRYALMALGRNRILGFWKKQGWIEEIPLPETFQDPKVRFLVFKVTPQGRGREGQEK
jgi:4-amino-4-deoxy-L-arabinose transferase-like glycosyltransferase